MVIALHASILTTSVRKSHFIHLLTQFMLLPALLYFGLGSEGMVEISVGLIVVQRSAACTTVSTGFVEDTTRDLSKELPGN